jgi:hypothetical protein
MNNYKTFNPKKLHPTQFCLGFLEVNHKVKMIKKMSKKKYSNYLIEKVTPVIIGPGNIHYLIDHHHHAKSLLLLGKKEIIIDIIADWSNLTPHSFQKKMIKSKFVNLLDNHNNKKQFEELPASILRLNHDYYRSLAWAIREKNGFKKVDNIPFFEFRWGEFFRQYIPEKLIINYFELAVNLGLKLAKSKDAEKLPGFFK